MSTHEHEQLNEKDNEIKRLNARIKAFMYMTKIANKTEEALHDQQNENRRLQCENDLMRRKIEDIEQIIDTYAYNPVECVSILIRVLAVSKTTSDKQK